MKASPLLRDTRAFCGVLLGDLTGLREHPTLCEHIGRGVLRLLDEVSLALGGFDPLAAAERADAELHCLRNHLLLAHELGLLDEPTFLEHAQQADLIGRQLGGWLKRLSGTSGGTG